MTTTTTTTTAIHSSPTLSRWQTFTQQLANNPNWGCTPPEIDAITDSELEDLFHELGWRGVDLLLLRKEFKTRQKGGLLDDGLDPFLLDRSYPLQLIILKHSCPTLSDAMTHIVRWLTNLSGITPQQTETFRHILHGSLEEIYENSKTWMVMVRVSLVLTQCHVSINYDGREPPKNAVAGTYLLQP